MSSELTPIECTVELTGVSPISFSKVIGMEKKPGEDHSAFEDRSWRDRMHVDKQGEVFIPSTALRNCLYDVAKFLGEAVPSKRGATYTKHFESGVMVTENLSLGVKAKSVEAERVFVPSDGKKGGGTRVWKNFPIVPAGWQTIGTIYVFDPVLIARPEKIHEYLIHAGKFIGMGRFRPRRGGYYGRFQVDGFEHQAIQNEVAA